MSEGWVCPVCGRVYAPWVPECTYHKTNTNAQGTSTTPYNIDYGHKETVTQPNTGDGKFYDHLTR